jgi:hypothetical protein
MRKREKVISSGPFKGKKIELASTSGVDALADICEDFMKRIFDMNPCAYVITDESRLHDFTGIDETDLTLIHDRIRTEYGLDVSHLSSGNLLEILETIRRRRVGELQ